MWRDIYRYGDDPPYPMPEMSMGRDFDIRRNDKSDNVRSPPIDRSRE